MPVTVSIHAPVKGATRWYLTLITGIAGFNSRTRKGCDAKKHSGAGGKSGFNSRTRKGCDDSSTAIFAVGTVSIHAPVKGATLCRGCLGHGINRFNSRTRKGCDRTYKYALYNTEVSIHAPVKGATATRKHALA